MSTVILSGTTLLEYVQQARNVCGPDFPIIGLNRQYHMEPSKTFNSLPHTEVDAYVGTIPEGSEAFQLTTSHFVSYSLFRIFLCCFRQGFQCLRKPAPCM